MRKPRIGVIVDDGRVARWQADALRTIADKFELRFYNCTNTRPSARRLRHALYYALNLVTIRNRMTRQIPLPAGLAANGEVSFAADYEGKWQILPDPLLDRIAADRVTMLLKFGMGLLKVPQGDRVGVPILSYHHGDPRSFRGRPAGFYEMMAGAACMGQVVQVLSNELDAGRVAAVAETRIYRHSYRATLLEAFRTSPALLSRAIENVLAGTTVALDKGRVYRLPSNAVVIRFCARLLRELIGRLRYGLFVEKRWHVAQADPAGPEPIGWLSRFPAMDQWCVEPLPDGYSFIADPFFHPGGEGILVEGMAKSTGLGEILHLAQGDVQQLSRGSGHLSYPATISLDGAHFVVPEIAQSGTVQLFRLTAEGFQPVPSFSVDTRPRLLDPTLLRHDGCFYLFANRLEEGAGVLRLWFSETLMGNFTEHPASPVRISPAGSRMAGNIVVVGKTLWRFGQDFTGEYGDGVLLFEIQELSPTVYREAERSRLKFAEVHGPHTVNTNGSRILFDFYTNAISPFAGLRRVRALMRTSEAMG